MTIQEYIDMDAPFYHISLLSNMDSILKNGLLPKTCNAICVVRSNEKIVWDNIISTQLPSGIEQKYCIIKLSPRKHGIIADNVAEDSIDEPTQPLHNYIVDIPCVKIDSVDVICENYVVPKSPGPVPNEMIERLEGYTRIPIPDTSNIPDY